MQESIGIMLTNCPWLVLREFPVCDVLPNQHPTVIHCDSSNASVVELDGCLTICARTHIERRTKAAEP
jgi:hypothetical protein